MKFNFLRVLALVFLVSFVGACEENVYSQNATPEDFCPEPLTGKPTIGVLANQKPSWWGTDEYGYQFVEQDYVTWLEAQGSFVIPVPVYYARDLLITDDTPDNPCDLGRYLDSVSAILFQGGTDRPDTVDIGKHLVAEIIQKNQQGAFFPLWGSCQGFEIIMMAVSGDDNILDQLNYEINAFLPMDLKERGRMFGPCNQGVHEAMRILSTDSTPNAHSKVLWLETFNNTPSLSDFFTLLGTSKDPVTGQEFVALVEGKEYPIYASQFHPEKLLKTGAPNRINQYDVNFSLYFARFLVNEALKTRNLFALGALVEYDFGNYRTENAGVQPEPPFYLTPDYYFPNGGYCYAPETCAFKCLLNDPV